MVKVAGVKFKNAGKVYYFDPDDHQVEPGDFVIVETARGLEFGTVSMEITEVSDDEVVQPLKKIIRAADEDDIKRHEENEKKKDKALKLCQEKIDKHGLEMKLIDVEYTFDNNKIILDDIKRHEENEKKKDKALKLCQEKIDKHGLEMKLIDVEYTFDNNKIIFYFTADGRVDFRELVKDLAGVFKMRIELRQIGVRDEAKMLGGIGSCGKSLCCSTWLSDFEPVSIKMAKVQNLSLNPTKISGICGRLMCCLKYENDVYMELRKGMPDTGEKVKTADGMGKVVETNILESKVKVRLYIGEKDDDGQEKLGTDIYTYKKEEIKRLGHKKHGQRTSSKDLLEEVEEEYLDELKALIKE